MHLLIIKSHIIQDDFELGFKKLTAYGGSKNKKLVYQISYNRFMVLKQPNNFQWT